MYHKFQNTKNVSSFNYDLSTGNLVVGFKSGRDYEYSGLTVADVLDFIKEEARKKLAFLCPGFPACSRTYEMNCHHACRKGAISHSW